MHEENQIDSDKNLSEKAQYLIQHWGHILRKHNFNYTSTLDDFNGLLALIGRNGGFDIDDPEYEMFNDILLCERVKLILASVEDDS